MTVEDIKIKALELRKQRRLKDRCEELLRRVNAEIKKIEESELNSAMLDEGVSELTVDGLKIKRDVVYRGGVTSNTDKAAFQYLFDTDNEAALKQECIISLADHPDIAATLDELGITYDIKYSIHHMTLSSILKELVMEGKFSTEDIEKYSVYVQPRITIKDVKK